MNLFVTILGSSLLLVVAAFCAFGFFATFEPTDNTTAFMAFRIGYAVIGIGCLVGAGMLIVYTARNRNEPLS